ncbi:histone acetyltransferase HAC1-like [Brassica napus]|uniref:histone acetyltransferase HAC1-like n=1 Tax=Brassica napus TaxID=3708 RepID=UPI0020791D0A|nr:histone acetyltransferase HAC1-like [Brassica napus]
MPANTYLEQQANVHALSGLKIENTTVEKAPLASNDSVSTSDMLKLKRVHAKACEDYLNPSTLTSRLASLIRAKKLNNYGQIQQNANSSSPGTMTTLAPEVFAETTMVREKVLERGDELETEIAENLKSMSLYS